MTHTLLDSPHGASRARPEITGNIGSYQVSSFLLDFGSPIRLPIALIERAIRANSEPVLFCANEVGKNWEKPLASRADQSKHPDEPLRLKEIWNENGTTKTGEQKRA